MYIKISILVALRIAHGVLCRDDPSEKERKRRHEVGVTHERVDVKFVADVHVQVHDRHEDPELADVGQHDLVVLGQAAALLLGG